MINGIGDNLSYIDEVIIELEQLSKKDKKIREARIEYAVLGNKPADVGNLANQNDSGHSDYGALARVQTNECINTLRVTAQALHQLHQSGNTGGGAPTIDLIVSANTMVMRTLSALTTAASQDIAGFVQSNDVTNEDQWIIHQLASYTALRSSTLQILREFALLLRAGDIETLHNHIKDSGNVVDDMVLLSVILLANINPPPVSEIKRFVQHNPKLKFATDIIKCSLESHIYIYGSENDEIKQLKELFDLHDNTLYGSMN